MLRTATRHAASTGVARLQLLVGQPSDTAIRAGHRHWPTAIDRHDGSLLEFTIPAADALHATPTATW
jgi:phage portal protein BeeE